MKKFSASSFFSILSGFTLIEIILVMAVSSVLLASGIALINPSFQLNRGNDARRKSDLLSIRSALEQYNGDNGDYPGSVGWCSQISDASKADVKTSLLSYMQKVPQDPKYAGTTKDYYYWHYESGQYRLYAVLDNASDTAASTQIQANDIAGSGASCPSNIAYNYKNDSFAPVGPTSTITLTPTLTPTITLTPTPIQYTAMTSTSFGSSTSTNYYTLFKPNTNVRLLKLGFEAGGSGMTYTLQNSDSSFGQAGSVIATGALGTVADGNNYYMATLAPSVSLTANSYYSLKIVRTSGNIRYGISAYNTTDLSFTKVNYRGIFTDTGTLGVKFIYDFGP
jgi:prepilin-type N-terminal cleavage/methylation domain-containing protein